MGRSKRRFEAISVAGEPSSTDPVNQPIDPQNAPDIPESLETNETTTRKTRGKTTMADVWSLPADKRIPVKCGKTWQPVENNGQVLRSFVGVVVRTHCPLNYLSWHKVPTGTKLHLFTMIKNKFDYPPQMHKWLKKTMSSRWRYYKCELKKKYFYCFETLEYNLERCPMDVQEDQWEYLVSLWMSHDGNKIEEASKKSRSCQKITHTTGSKSFEQKIHEYNKDNGTNVGRIEAYKITHTRKDGTYINENVPEIIEKARVELLKRSKNSDVDPFTGELDILAKVAESRHHGRVFGLGIGPTPTDIFGRQAPIAAINHTNEEFNNVVKELAEEKHMRIAQGDIIKTQGDMIQSLQEQMAEMRRLIELQSAPRKHRKSGHGNRPSGSSNSGQNNSRGMGRIY